MFDRRKGILQSRTSQRAIATTITINSEQLSRTSAKGVYRGDWGGETWGTGECSGEFLW